MIDLQKHDSLIKRFLGDTTVLRIAVKFLKYKGSEILLRHIISHEWLQSDPMQYKGISKARDLEKSAIGDSLKIDLNGSLKTLCDNYRISPPIQLYFRTQKFNVDNIDVSGNSNIGAHFACSINIVDNVSGTFVTKNELLTMLSNSLMQIKGIGQQDALQILEPGLPPLKLKYFRDIREVLKWDDPNVNAQWFRKSGPIAADFDAGYVFQRKERLCRLREYISENNISILEGEGGTGKSVLIRNYAYNLLKENVDAHIYHYSFKTDPAIADFHDFLNVLNEISGIVIIEDIHLAAAHMQHVVDGLRKEIDVRILMTARPSFKNEMLSFRPNTLKELSSYNLNDCDCKEDKDDTDFEGLIDFYLSRNSKPKAVAKKMKAVILEACEGNFWLLSYALKGFDGTGKAIDWIKEGVLEDLRDIANPAFHDCKPEILVALSPLYMNEVYTSQSFLIRKLGFNRADIEKLVKIGEILKHKEEDKIFYGLSHSTLASIYWEYGEEYKVSFEVQDYEGFIYHYAISGESNSLRAITNLNPETKLRILNKLAENKEIDSVVENENPLYVPGGLLHYIVRTKEIDAYYKSDEFIENLKKAISRPYKGEFLERWKERWGNLNAEETFRNLFWY